MGYLCLSTRFNGFSHLSVEIDFGADQSVGRICQPVSYFSATPLVFDAAAYLFLPRSLPSSLTRAMLIRPWGVT
jgi:hypothetical protein